MSLPADVERFLRERISSVNELELLLLLREDPDRWWTAAGAAKHLYQVDVWAVGQLEAFVATGLARRKDGSPPEYAWGDVAADLAATVDRTADAFRKRRTRVIGVIFKPPATAQRFADAFRLRASDEEDDT